MRLLRHHLIALVAVCSVLGACSSDKSEKSASTSGAQASAASSGATSANAGDAGTQAPAVAGDVDCAALKDSVTNIVINWQVVIGLTNSASTEWAQIPIGSIPQFGDQLAVATGALGQDAGAAAALQFMSGANDIVMRGLGGDAAAQADLTEYLGTDVTANISKQIPISVAYQNAGCE